LLVQYRQFRLGLRIEPELQRFSFAVRKPVNRVLKRLGATSAKFFESFFCELVQSPGLYIGINLLVPQFLAQFLQPVGYLANLLRLQLLDGGFDFLNRVQVSP